MTAAPDYLVVGHVTRDLRPDGSSVAGGTATYAALAAERLGLAVGVLTSAPAGEAVFGGSHRIMLRCKPSERATTFENVYVGPTRRQYLRAVAAPLSLGDLPPAWRGAPIVHLGPVAQEVEPSFVTAFANALVGVTPQGWLRRWDAQGLVSPVEWESAEMVLERADVVVLSYEDIACRREYLAALVERAKLLVLTVGPEGAIVYRQRMATRVPAYRVVECDPTGAGDVFAATFFVRYAETGDALEAARYANCAASFVIEAEGASNIPDREQIAWRLKHGELRS